MGYDAFPGLQGVFFNKIISKRSLFEDVDAKIFDYVGNALANRSGLGKFLRRIGIIR